MGFVGFLILAVVIIFVVWIALGDIISKVPIAGPVAGVVILIFIGSLIILVPRLLPH